MTYSPGLEFLDSTGAWRAPQGAPALRRRAGSDRLRRGPTAGPPDVRDHPAGRSPPLRTLGARRRALIAIRRRLQNPGRSGMLGQVWKVTISLLGGFSAAVDGAPVPETAWRLKKARELVKLLALAPGHRMQREQAMDVLWRDRDPAAAANNLNQAVYIARRALDSEAIVVRDESLQLSADVDVDRLREAADGARRAGTPGAYS